MNFKWTAFLLFGGFALVYLFFSPGAVAGMGYTGEDIKAGDEMISYTLDLVERHPNTTRIDWPRNGVAPLFFDLPFLLAGRLHGQKEASQDLFLSAGPILATALLVTILFLWLRELTANPVWSFYIALIAGFATFLWPYAYIGLETKQSLALFLAAYLALGVQKARGAGLTVLFVCACAAAVSVKSTGIFLGPAVLYLVYEYFRRAPRSARSLAKVACALVFIGVVFAANAYARSLFWEKIGGTRGFLNQWMIHDVTSFFANLVSFFTSPNKGLFWYAPPTLLGIAAIWKLPADLQKLKWLALLTLAGLACGFSLLTDWSDETWGPRYLHSTVAPLMLCLGAGSYPFRHRAKAALAALAFAGLWIAFLGSFFSYGSLQGAATVAGQDTLEAYQGDIVWNHIRFDARLMGTWLGYGDSGSPEPVWWVPDHHWFYAVPPGAAPWKAVDLRPFSQPQALSVRDWSLPPGVVRPPVWYLYFASLPIGIALLIWVFFRIKRELRRAGPLARSSFIADVG